MDGWNTSFLFGWPIFRGYVAVVSGGVSVVSWSFVPFIDNEKNKGFLVHTKEMIRATRVLKKSGPSCQLPLFLEVWFFRFFHILILIFLNLDKLLYMSPLVSACFSLPTHTPQVWYFSTHKKNGGFVISPFRLLDVLHQQHGWNPNDLYFWRSTPPKQGLNSNQNKGHLGSRYIYMVFFRNVFSQIRTFGTFWWGPASYSIHFWCMCLIQIKW